MLFKSACPFFLAQETKDFIVRHDIKSGVMIILRCIIHGTSAMAPERVTLIESECA